jgi:hypothetical protein
MMMMAMLLTTVAVMAQHEEGEFTVMPKVGLNIATLSDADKAIADLHFGLEAEYMVTDNFSLGLGAIVSNQGAKYTSDGADATDATVDLDYVHIPILGSYYLLPGLAVKVGVQPGFKMKAKVKGDGATVDLDEYFRLLNPLLDADMKVNSFTFSIPVGVSYEYRNVVVDARYNWGLTKVLNQGDAFYNRVFMLSLGYKFVFGN